MTEIPPINFGKSTGYTPQYDIERVVPPSQRFNWNGMRGKPYIIVSSKGLKNGLSDIYNDGADFGPDTPGTQTSGIQESLDYIIKLNEDYAIYFIPGLYTINQSIAAIINKDIALLTGIMSTGSSAADSNQAYGVQIKASSNFPQTNTNPLIPGSSAYMMYLVASQSNTNAICMRGGFTFNGSGLNIGAFLCQPNGGNTQYPSLFNIDRIQVINCGLSGLTLQIQSGGGPTYVNVISMTHSNGYIIVYGPSVRVGHLEFFLNNGQLCMNYEGGVLNIESVYWQPGVNDQVCISPSIGGTHLSIGYIYAQTISNSGCSLFKGAADIAVSDIFLVPSSEMVSIINSPGVGGGNTDIKISNMYIPVSTNVTGDLVGGTSGIDFPLIIDKLYVYNENSYTLFTLNTNYNSYFKIKEYLINGAPGFKKSTKSITSGAIYQNINPYDILVQLPVTYNPTSAAAATLGVGLDSINTPTVNILESEPAGIAVGRINTLTLKVPAGWYYEFAVTNATLGTAIIYVD